MKTLNLIDALIEKQQSEGWSYREMAGEIGVNHTTWYYVVKGERRPSVWLIQKILKRFPDLQALALLYLQSGDTNGQHSDTGDTAA